MKTIKGPLRVLVCAAVCIFLAPWTHAPRVTFAQTARPSGLNVEKMSSMGHLAHLAATGRLNRALAKARAAKPGGKSVLADVPAFSKLAK